MLDFSGELNLQNSKFPTLFLCAVRVLSIIANLASKYDSSNPCSFEMTCFMILNFFLENLDFKQFKRMEIPNLVVGYFEGTLRISGVPNCKSYVRMRLLKCS